MKMAHFFYDPNSNSYSRFDHYGTIYKLEGHAHRKKQKKAQIYGAKEIKECMNCKVQKSAI